ncbi:unnamed protein product [Adineta ricciae]|uniref:MARVEL domain-containing protein n=1 Tax=Adineta ricciae TaxID=249248 RepID=A0A815VI63_ADIRI|nr:unnamed protein product [Adineta ricciae]CAF1535515.1 unnamed protein product [Adineta ricciae]
MLAHSVQRGGRHPIGYGRGLTPIDYKWKALWPSLLSRIIGALIVLSGLLLFVLEIASLGLLGKIGITPSLYGCAVGIWAGIFIMTAGVLILMIAYMKSVRLWALIAFCATVAATIFAIIDFSIVAARVADLRSAGAFDSIFTDVKSVAGLNGAQLAFGLVAFLLCLAFIGLYVHIYMKIRKYR